MTLMTWSTAILLATLGIASPSFEEVALTGQVVMLNEALKSFELSSDAGPIEQQAALVTEDGAVVPLLSTPASRALFLDAELRDRPIQIQARRFPGLPYVQVTSFRVQEDGVWRTPEYYCDICTISVRYPQICPCCQGSMDLRMKPGEH